MPSALRRVFRIEAEMQQRVVMRAGDHGDVAAAPAIAAARSPARHILLAPERQTAVAAIPGLYADSYLIYEHGEKGGWGLGAERQDVES